MNRLAIFAIFILVIVTGGEVVAATRAEEQPLKKLQACTGVGENCVHIPCCPTSANGNPVICSEGPYNSVCVELFPGPSWKWLSKLRLFF